MPRFNDYDYKCRDKYSPIAVKVLEPERKQNDFISNCETILRIALKANVDLILTLKFQDLYELNRAFKSTPILEIPRRRFYNSKQPVTRKLAQKHGHPTNNHNIFKWSAF